MGQQANKPFGDFLWVIFRILAVSILGKNALKTKKNKSLAIYTILLSCVKLKFSELLFKYFSIF